MRLCFGSYANVLFLCRVQSLTKTKLLNAIVRSVDAECELSPSAITWLTQCTANLPNTRKNSRGDIVSNAQDADTDKTAKYFAQKIVPLIDANKRKNALLAILEIIKNDGSIHSDDVVDKVSAATKKALLTQSKFDLPKFLAGMFLFVTGVNNIIGKEAVSFITDKFIDSFAGRQAAISLITPRKENNADTAADAVHTYLAHVKEKYGYVKTLLFKEQPMPFYSLYVTNDVEQSISRVKSNVIRNATAESFTSVSNFIILDGIGGMGKSMMMRHLLLNAADSFEKYRRVPIFIPLKDFGESEPLIDFIYSKTETPDGRISKTALENMLAEGSCLLLLDGMDEIKANRSQRFESELEKFTDKYPKNHYVISSRPYQSFISFSRFTVLRISPFTHAQALTLIDKLAFRPDEPGIKDSFRNLLRHTLYATHQPFAENPLLLTIMLLIFEKYANIPTQLHIFYYKAFVTLYEEHDATKGGFRRLSKTKFLMETFSDYFAEFCFHTYKDYKFEFTDIEFARYFSILRANESKAAGAGDFAYDLCVNLCLMFLEGDRYYFMHRSFQEYFCALFFSKQKDNVLAKLGAFFESRQGNSRSDQTFQMLYDMIPDKIEANVFIPYLQDLFDECDKAGGYWGFLEKMYPCICYEKGEVTDYSAITPKSYLFSFITGLVNPKYKYNCDDLPDEDDFVVKEFGYIFESETVRELVSLENVFEDHEWLREVPEAVGWNYRFNVKDIVGGTGYQDTLEMLDNDEFIFKSEYLAVRRYFEKIKEKQQNADDFFMDLLG